MMKVATLAEIREHWTLCDVADANDVLDIKEETEFLMMERTKAEMKRNAPKGRK